MTGQQFEKGGVVNYLIDLPIRALMWLFGLLPYRASLSFAGWLMSRVIGPPFGTNSRIRANLEHVWPDMQEADKRRLCREAGENATRLMLESFRVPDFLDHAARAEMQGAGKAALLEALEAGRPVILVSGHFGNYQVLRVLLRLRGYPIAAIYRPMSNAFTNRRYIDNMDRIAAPNHSRGMAGTKALLTHLKNGGAILLLNDQAAGEGKVLRFLGKPALTMTSAAEFALKYDALLFPFYGIRQPNGVDFEVEVEAPVPHSDPETMTQALNDSLEARVLAHPGQWFWMHRRWKGL
ncbi:MAG: lauroyl acyltransferase [Rhodobacteraceae bacterium]|nr:lauroyl acyltransferase [Paracoccaceae bacterium]